MAPAPKEILDRGLTDTGAIAAAPTETTAANKSKRAMIFICFFRLFRPDHIQISSIQRQQRYQQHTQHIHQFARPPHKSTTLSKQKTEAIGPEKQPRVSETNSFRAGAFVAFGPLPCTAVLKRGKPYPFVWGGGRVCVMVRFG